MKQVYKCEFCEEISEDKETILKHEKECGSNPKNKITNEMVLKLSRIYEHFEDSLIYVLLQDYTKKDIDFYIDEFDRAQNNNCPASIFENKRELDNILRRRIQIDRECRTWFENLTKRDNPELISAIRSYLKEPEYRI